MPDALAHRFFADDNIESMPKDLKAIVKENLVYFDIGSTGPDAFYYYAFIPWYSNKKRTEIAHFGDLIHTQKINDFFKFGFAYYEQAPAYFKAYFLGFMSHYMLDRHAHPFIFYRSGFASDEKKGYYSMMHKRYELTMDALLSSHHYHEALYAKKHFQFLKMNHLTFDAIDTFYSEVATKIYDLDVSKKQVNQSFRAYALIYRILHDPKGIKRRFLKHFEKPSFPIFSSSLYSASAEKGYDVLNLKKETWLDPCTKEPHQTSFHDIVNEAGDDLNHFYQLFDLYLKEKKSIQPLLTLIGNRQFDTNHQPNESKMIVHESIYDQKS